jgi:hypothetical protein
MMANKTIGIVQNSLFQPLHPDPGAVRMLRLTATQIMESRPPESQEIDLRQYEGKAIMVLGHEDGEWIFGADVVGEACLILTAVVQRVFGQTGANA